MTAFRHLKARHAGRSNGERRMLEGSITISVSNLAPDGIVHLHTRAACQRSVKRDRVGSKMVPFEGLRFPTLRRR